MKQPYNIWAEGYVTQGNASGANHLGIGFGETFKEACEDLARNDEDFKKYFDSNRMTYWGCGLFDNDVDARKNFG